MQEALWRMEDSRLSVEQLTALSRAVPEEQERRDIGLFLKVRDTFLFRQHALCVNTFGAAEHRDSLYKAVRISRKIGMQGLRNRKAKNAAAGALRWGSHEIASEFSRMGSGEVCTCLHQIDEMVIPHCGCAGGAPQAPGRERGGAAGDGGALLCGDHAHPAPAAAHRLLHLHPLLRARHAAGEHTALCIQ